MMTGGGASGAVQNTVGGSPLSVLVAQLSPAPRALEQNAAMISRTIREHPRSDLVVFPELFLTGYETAGLDELRLTSDSEVFDPIRSACRNASTAAVVGFIEGAGENTYDSVLVIASDGADAGVYRKTHLFGAEGDVFDVGNDLVLVDVLGVRVGLLICFDVEFPEPARILARGGAQVLVTIAANMEPYFADHELASRARALDNRIPHVYVNMVGATGEFNFVGGSRIVRQDGSVLAACGGDEQLLSGQVDLERSPDSYVDYLRFLAEREERYGALSIRGE